MICQATIEDADEIFEVINDAYSLELGDTGIAFKSSRRLSDKFAGGLDKHYDNGSVVKCVVDGVIAGVIVWDVIQINGENSLFFGPFAVRTSYQGRGVGKSLLQEIDRIAIEKSIVATAITVVNHRSDNMAYYTKLGYVPYGDTIPFPEAAKTTRPTHMIPMMRFISQ